jgi:hypothetical protein
MTVEADALMSHSSVGYFARSDWSGAAGDETRHHREAPAPFELLTYGARATGVPPTGTARSGLTAQLRPGPPCHTSVQLSPN